MKKAGGRPPSGPPYIFSFVWLFYLVFPIYSFLSRPIDELMEGMTLLTVFVALYLYSYRRETGRLYSVLWQLIIVGLLSFRYDASFIYFTFYPSPLVGMLKTKKQMVISLAAMVALFTAVGWHSKLYMDSDSLIQLVPAMLIMLALPFAIRVGHKSRELRQKLYVANEEIARLSKNEERQRISRDLHDTLGHTLSLITLKSELAEKLISLNAVTIHDEMVHAKQILTAAGIGLDTKNELDGRSLSPLIDNILGMCLRESVTNVVKHSHASMCKLELLEQPGSLQLIVTDDGSGTDNMDNELTSSAACNGLQGMRDRLKLVEGVMEFDSAVHKGTRLLFTVPLVNKSGGEGEMRI
jgi:two-component system, NarL family, sensor histidine kinase DesK